MTKNSALTYTAADELDRRKANRGLTPAQKLPVPATAEGRRLQAMSAADLRAEAGVSTPVTNPGEAERKAAARAKMGPAPARRKPARTPEQQAATEARKLAWAWRLTEVKAGRKVSYADACAKFGTTPAKAAK